jgi:AraC-like DNA-binding protein
MPDFARVLVALRDCALRHADTVDGPSALPGLRLMRADTPTRPLLHVCEPTFTLVLQGRARTVLGMRSFDCGPGQCLVFPVDLPIEASVIEASPHTPFLALRLTLQPERIAALLLDGRLTPAPPDDNAGGALAVAVGPVALDAMQALARLLALLDTPADLPVLSAAIEREVLWRLLNGAQGPLIRQIGAANGRMVQIVRAIRLIREHYAGTLGVEALAHSVGMSPSSFHRHFRAITSMTPLQYQKQIRMQAARARLMARAEDVAAVGFAVGYNNPSQFSREYRRMFGRPPGRDGERLRAMAGEAPAA